MPRSLAALVLALCAAAPAAADPVDEYVRAAMAAEKIPGVCIAIVHGGELVKAEGYGLANVELDVPATPDTVYQSGSTAKQFTAAGILLLAEEGTLSLDDRLSKHFPDGPSAWHRITIRQLLTHTSGMKDYEGPHDIDLRRDYGEPELLEVMMGLPLEFEPGTQWSYSNSGYVTLGLLTSRLAGMHWSAFQAERLFEPLGMATARVISERDIVENRAAGYVLDEAGELKNQDWVAPTLNRIADGAIYYTVKDLVAWDAALREGKFLSEESLEAWWTPVRLAGGTSFPYGFGWRIAEQRGQRLLEHGGSWQGFRAAIARYVDQSLTVVVLANLASAQPEAMAHAIAGLVEPSLALPDADATLPDPDPGRAEALREVLDAWADSRVTPGMGKGLAETASGSAREAHDRLRTGQRVAALTAFRFIGEDDLAATPLGRRGETVTRIAHYALDTKDTRYVYRFYLTEDGRVADFDAEER
jgi:CubicO group peptidase (beta-lactamase class C family)